MNTWTKRLRLALLLSPAFMLLHAWLIALLYPSLSTRFGFWELIGLALASSVVEAYIVVLTIATGIEWSKRG